MSLGRRSITFAALAIGLGARWEHGDTTSIVRADFAKMQKHAAGRAPSATGGDGVPSLTGARLAHLFLKAHADQVVASCALVCTRISSIHGGSGAAVFR